MQSPSKFKRPSQRFKNINPKVHLEAQKIEKGKENSEQKEQCWRYHNT
jgi:hypothetical protein